MRHIYVFSDGVCWYFSPFPFPFPAFFIGTLNHFTAFLRKTRSNSEIERERRIQWRACYRQMTSRAWSLPSWRSLRARPLRLPGSSCRFPPKFSCDPFFALLFFLVLFCLGLWKSWNFAWSVVMSGHEIVMTIRKWVCSEIGIWL